MFRAWQRVWFSFEFQLSSSLDTQHSPWETEWSFKVTAMHTYVLMWNALHVQFIGPCKFWVTNAPKKGKNLQNADLIVNVNNQQSNSLTA